VRGRLAASVCDGVGVAPALAVAVLTAHSWSGEGSGMQVGYQEMSEAFVRQLRIVTPSVLAPWPVVSRMNESK
jgi:hypothetical protein